MKEIIFPYYKGLGFLFFKKIIEKESLQFAPEDESSVTQTDFLKLFHKINL